MYTYLSKRDYITLYLLLSVVYISGLWIPLMENDSAQHATMAMRMYLENDFLNIYKGTNDYLDKPHLHFWLAAFSFKIFGISDWAYRIPALLFTILGAFSANGLAKEFYGNKASHIASLVFLSAQAIILSNHDVRTDAVLTGATIFGIWQLVLFVKTNKIINIIFGSIGVAMAFSTKGQLGVFVPGVCLLSYIFFANKWKALWTWKIFVGLLVFVLSISPVLYAYYVQFDLHPEKVINGQNNISGLRFILWDQSLNRLNASGFEETSPDYFFFFHTLLWAFLPWSVLVYLALFSKFKTLIQSGFKINQEALTSVGVLIVLIVISFSKFKLPHYLNSLLPILAVLVTGYLIDLYSNRKQKTIKILLHVNFCILTLATAFVILIIFWSFTLPSIPLLICDVLLLGLVFYFIIFRKNSFQKIILVSLCFMIFTNFCLNTQFYPKLLEYQSGITAAKIIDKEKIDTKDVYVMAGDQFSWSLDFYNKSNTKRLEYEQVLDKKYAKKWLFVYENQLKKLQEKNINFGKKFSINHYGITMLNATFLNPKTRESILEKAFLIQLK